MPRSVITRLCVLLMAGAIPALADFISLTGNLDPQNANDVLLISFSLSAAADVNMQSYGFGGSAKAPGGTNANGQVIASGGFDTYFSLFTGTGPGATFLVSNDDGLCPPGDDTEACSDSTLDIVALAAGSYTLAVSAFDNFSFAENLGSGTLGDGFIGLGSYFSVATLSDRTSAYAVDIVAQNLTLIDAHRLSDVSTTVPEPATILLLGTILLCVRNRKKPAGIPHR